VWHFSKTELHRQIARLRFWKNKDCDLEFAAQASAMPLSRNVRTNGLLMAGSAARDHETRQLAGAKGVSNCKFHAEFSGIV
jgi:hypothetical protein